MQLSCEVCRSPLRAEDVRLELAVAKCHACNAIYDLSGRKAGGQGLEGRRKLQRVKVALPPRFKVEDTETTTRISWRWLSGRMLALAAFCVVWDGFLAVWYGIAFNMKDPPLMMILFPLLHLAVGIGLTYMVLTGFFNRTRIEVSRDRVAIRHGPLPWHSNQTLEGRSLTQLYGEEVRGRPHKNGELPPTYCLHAMDRQGNKVTLLKDLEEKDQVLYLEQMLERRLGIEDAPVDGEVATRMERA